MAIRLVQLDLLKEVVTIKLPVIVILCIIFPDQLDRTYIYHENKFTDKFICIHMMHTDMH